MIVPTRNVGLLGKPEEVSVLLSTKVPKLGKRPGGKDGGREGSGDPEPLGEGEAGFEI